MSDKKIQAFIEKTLWNSQDTSEEEEVGRVFLTYIQPY